MAVVRKTRTGKWELDFRRDGKRERITFESKREAEDAKREVVLGIPSQKAEGAVSAKTLKDAIRFYDQNVSAAKASHENEQAYLKRLFKALRQSGCVMLHDVKAEHLEVFKTERLTTCKASTVNREFNTIRHFFSKCVEFDWLASNPAAKVVTLPGERNPRRTWTSEEFEAVLRSIPPWAAEVMQAICWTGAGPKELSRVTWADVDFDRRTILLRRFKGKGKTEFRRHQPMPDALYEFMLTLYASATRRRRNRPIDPAFLNSRGNAIDARPLATLVRRAVRFNKLPEGTVPYGMRHTFATDLLSAGVGDDLVRRLMGHQDVRTLIQNYSHIKDAALREAMEVRATQVSASKKGDGEAGR